MSETCSPCLHRCGRPRGRWRTWLGVLLVLGAVAAGAQPAAAGPVRGVELIANVAYAPAEPAGSRGHLLDLYIPETPGRARTPLLIWTGGSGWLADNGKDSAAPVAERFTAKGYAVAGVSIRSSTQAPFPAQVYDIKAAIRWLRAHARAYGIDSRRIAIMGNSSGGWASAMAALTGGVGALEGNVGVQGGVSSRVQAAVPFFPPTDFLQMDAHMIDCPFFNRIFGLTDCHNDPLSPESRMVGCPIQTCPAAVQRANPITYGTPDDPPMLILHGQLDLLVPHHQSELLFAALRKACRDVTFYSVPGAGHSVSEVTAGTEGTTARTARSCHKQRERVETGPTWETIERWLNRALRRHRGPRSG
jgi:acetyl esterase/lipase